MKIKIKFTRMNKNWAILFCCMLISFLAPHYFLEHSLWGEILDIWIYGSLLLIALHCVKNIKKISGCIWLPILMYAFLLFSTVVNNNSSVAIVAVIKHSIKVIFMCCLIETLISDNKKLECFLRVVRNITLVFFIMNLITNIFYPQGIPSITQNSEYPYFIYGNVNSTIRMVLPGMCCSSILDFREGKRISVCSWIFIVGCLYTFVFIYPTTTTMIAVIIVTFWMLFSNRLFKVSQKIYVIAICGVVLLELLVVVVSNSSVIALITGIFNKSSDLTGRTVLWNNALQFISENPIWGYGRQMLSEIKMAIGLETGCHNYFLDIMYQRGVIGLGLLAALIIKPVVSIKKRQLASTESLYVLFGYCIALLAMFFAEPFCEYECYFIPIFYALFVLVSKKNKKPTSEVTKYEN